jgi:2-oxoisovalerate dehydrogenase E1 component
MTGVEGSMIRDSGQASLLVAEGMADDVRTDRMRDLYARALLIRGVEERLLSLFAEGKLFGTVHTCIGQEWTGIAIAEALIEGDIVFTNHRGHGHFLARTGDVDGLIAEVMGKQSGVCAGRGGSQHLCSGGVLSNGVQGGIVPVSAGIALAQRLQGTGRIAVVFIGDGTLGEGAVYEAFNIASKWQLPLLIVLENNRYAQSTPQSQTLAGEIEARATAFGIVAERADTWKPEALLLAAARCVAAVRRGNGPRFLRVDTDRLMAHSKGDDDREPAEVQAYWERDPLVACARENPAWAEALKAEVRQRIDAAVASAEAAPYTEAPPAAAARPPVPLTWRPTRIAAADRLVNLIHDALERNMQRDGRIVLIGEDIEGPYGGAFKVTKNLSRAFPGRVRNTPISEAAIVGLGNGLALSGLIPVCEIMFGDFLTLAADQLINHAAKFRSMYNGQVDLRLIVRTPMGGKRGYGPTHSQCLEKHFLGLPDTRMLALHHRDDPGALYDTLFATIDRPTIVIENKLLYGLRVSAAVPEGFALEQTDELFPTTRIRPECTPDLTILCYGGMLADVEKALDPLFDAHETACEVICPTQLYPLDLRPILDSIERTSRLLVVEEGIAFAAFGAEVVAQIVESTPGALRQLRRLAAPEHPIPACGPLEKALLPGPAHVVAAALELCAR